MTAPVAAPTQDVVLAQYVASQQAVRASLIAALTRMWNGLSAWRDADAVAFARSAVPLVAGAQRATSSLTSAYLVRSIAQGTRQPIRMPGVAPGDFVGAAVRDADPFVVYQRPFGQVWKDLALDKPLDEAVGNGLLRLQVIAQTDVQLAKTATSKAVLGNAKDVIGYRRVLTGDRSCGLCIVASTQRYHKQNLMPLHPGCDCAVAPILRGEPAAPLLEPDVLAGTHDAIEQRFGKAASGARVIDGVIRANGKPLSYRDVLISHDHGEIGPVLAVRGQKFTGPSEIPGGS